MAVVRMDGKKYIAFRAFRGLGKSSIDWSKDNEYVNKFHVGRQAPTTQDIIKQQKKIITGIYVNRVKRSEELTLLENDIFKYQSVQGQEFEKAKLSSTVAQDIQNTMIGLNDKEMKKMVQSADSEDDIKRIADQLKNNLEAWGNILKYFEGSGKNITGHGLTKALAALRRNIIAVERKTEDIILRVDNKQLNVIFNQCKLEKSKSFFRSMSGIASVLKGLLTEAYGAEYLNNIFKSFKQDKVAIKTGSISVGGKDVKSDILIFNRDTKVRFNGEDVSIDELEKEINKCNTTISVPLDEWDTWMKAAISGVTSKNVSGKRTVFHKGFPFKDIINQEGKIESQYNESFWNLYHYHQIYEQYHTDIQLSKIQGIRNMANYMISRHIPRIIGSKNYLYLTEKGIKDTGTVIYEQLNTHKNMFKIYNFGPGKEQNIGLNISKS